MSDSRPLGAPQWSEVELRCRSRYRRGEDSVASASNPPPEQHDSDKGKEAGGYHSQPKGHSILGRTGVLLWIGEPFAVMFLHRAPSLVSLTVGTLDLTPAVEPAGPIGRGFQRGGNVLQVEGAGFPERSGAASVVLLQDPQIGEGSGTMDSCLSRHAPNPLRPALGDRRPTERRLLPWPATSARRSPAIPLRHGPPPPFTVRPATSS